MRDLLKKLQGLALSIVLGITAANADPTILETREAMLETLNRYNGAVLFLGHGSKGQFKDVDSVFVAVDAKVADFNSKYGEGKWVAVFGGDNFNVEKPDIAHVLKYLKDKHGVAIMAIQSDVVIPWGGVDKHLDFVRYIPTVTLPVLDPEGKQVVENGKLKTKTHWGGFIDGEPRGPTEIYLGADFIGGENPILKNVVALGGGPIGFEETKYAFEKGVPVTYIRAEAKFPEVNGQYGSLDRWALNHANRFGPGEICELPLSQEEFRKTAAMELRKR